MGAVSGSGLGQPFGLTFRPVGAELIEGGWSIESERGPAQLLLERSAQLVGLPVTTRMARILEAERPAVVLGSGQAADVIDAAEAESHGIDVVRRRSGGGAVLVVQRDHQVSTFTVLLDSRVINNRYV